MKYAKHEFVIKGNPIPLARARINPKAFFNNVKRKMWDPQKELKLVTAITLENQFEGVKPLTGALRLEVIFYMPIPQSYSHKKKLDMEGIPHISKPDLDNLIKWIGDCANNLLYSDDAIIAEIKAQKKYDNNPRTVFTLERISNED